jgi:hypothetical protein
MAHPAPARIRDLRLDFFRGLSLFIILVSHTRGAVLADWIPARFGLSDAANMFVFVSGYAVGIAFVGVYKRRGWLLGTIRVFYRIWQLYLAQLVMVMFVSALAIVADWVPGTGMDHAGMWWLDRLFSQPRPAILEIVTLTYVPHYLDILPVYIAVLAMVPIAMALARRIHPLAVPVASIALWTAANVWGWNMPNEPSEPRGWYFDPFCWQLLFFTGLSISAGFLKPPPVDRRLFWLAVAYLVSGLVVTRPEIFTRIDWLVMAQQWISAHADKTMVDPLQYLHFLAAAYVMVVLLKGRGHLIAGPTARPLVKCGQQSLAVFLSGIVLADLGGLAFEYWGDGPLAQTLVTLVGFAITLGVAYGVSWIKGPPWAGPREPTPVARRAAVAVEEVGA